MSELKPVTRKMPMRGKWFRYASTVMAATLAFGPSASNACSMWVLPDPEGCIVADAESANLRSDAIVLDSSTRAFLSARVERKRCPKKSVIGIGLTVHLGQFSVNFPAIVRRMAEKDPRFPDNTCKDGVRAEVKFGSIRAAASTPKLYLDININSEARLCLTNGTVGDLALHSAHEFTPDLDTKPNFQLRFNAKHWVPEVQTQGAAGPSMQVKIVDAIRSQTGSFMNDTTLRINSTLSSIIRNFIDPAILKDLPIRGAARFENLGVGLVVNCAPSATEPVLTISAEVDVEQELLAQALYQRIVTALKKRAGPVDCFLCELPSLKQTVTR